MQPNRDGSQELKLHYDLQELSVYERIAALPLRSVEDMS